jgi:hypothetical protein
VGLDDGLGLGAVQPALRETGIDGGFGRGFAAVRARPSSGAA